MHNLCPACGSSLLVDPSMENPELVVLHVWIMIPQLIYGVAAQSQVRMIKDIDLDRLEHRKFDGKSRLEPPYQM